MSERLSDIRRFIVAHYDLDELRTLCFDLGVNFDDLQGEMLSGKARELILQLARTRALQQLLQALHQSRSKAFEEADLGWPPEVVDSLYAELRAFDSSTTNSRRLAGVHYTEVKGQRVDIDNRSGGVYFEGQGPVHINGDVVGHGQTKIDDKTRSPSEGS